MIDAELLEKCIKPGTPRSLLYWILFTNQHHNSHRTHDETVQAFKGTVLGEDIDFEKLAILSQPKPEIIMVNPDPDHSVTIVFEDMEVAKLYRILDEYKYEYPDLFEKVHQAMTDVVLERIRRG